MTWGTGFWICKLTEDRAMSHRMEQLIRLCTARIETHTNVELPYWAERDAVKTVIIETQIKEAEIFKKVLEKATGEIDFNSPPLQEGEEIFTYLRRWYHAGCPVTIA
jgi:hypothetical protein